MTIPGRPTLYRPEYDEEAHDHCLLGATNAGLADLFGVAPRTIDNWIANIPEFAKAVREGRAVADARVARSLYERAVGYRHTVERTVLHRGEERKLTNTVQYPPDTQACIFWLRNRRRENWSVREAARPEEADSETLIAILDAAGERARQGGD
jgi:hypothetical protein